MPKIKTTESFIAEARSVHGEYYDYSMVHYVNSKTEVTIICPDHGKFDQIPANHLKGKGCPKCGQAKRHNKRTFTNEVFISKSTLVHGSRYDYSKVNYINNHEKVCIICPEHGEFMQAPSSHMAGKGCPQCAGNNALSTESFIERASQIFGGQYDYSKVVYKNTSTPVCIVCPEHGEFWKSPHNHLNGQGCPLCSRESIGKLKRNPYSKFIDEAQLVHGNKYDYSRVKYRDWKTKVNIVCPSHGSFEQSPYVHINLKCGCPICAGNVNKTSAQFIQEARQVHGDKYSYDLVEYRSGKLKVSIECPEHGIFLQTPSAHLRGAGCPGCSGNKKLTREAFILAANSIHEGKYDYSKVQFTNSQIKVLILCPEHGWFWQEPTKHLCGKGCPTCARNQRGLEQRISLSDFIKRARSVHGSTYDYSKSEYLGFHEPICIICQKHGEFWQKPSNHLLGNGCPVCSNSKLEDEIRQLLIFEGIRFEEEKKFPWLKSKKKMRLDFYLPDFNTTIECQGLQHFTPQDTFGGVPKFMEGIKRDALKRSLCEQNGIRVLYYSNLGICYPYHVYEDKIELIKEIKK